MAGIEHIKVEADEAGMRLDRWFKAHYPGLSHVALQKLARSGQLLIRAIIGMSLGFAYFVVDNAAVAMGGFGGYPPFLAAFAPFFLFLLIGETMLIRTEE